MTKYNDKIMNKRLKEDGFQFDKKMRHLDESGCCK